MAKHRRHGVPPGVRLPGVAEKWMQTAAAPACFLRLRTCRQGAVRPTGVSTMGIGVQPRRPYLPYMSVLGVLP